MRTYACTPSDQTQDAAELFRALGDPLRIKLLSTLAAHGEMCVCKLVDALGEPQPKVSQHLRVLRLAGFVACRRVGTWAYYRLVPPRDDLERWVHVCLRDHLAAEAGPNLGGACRGG